MEVPIARELEIRPVKTEDMSAIGALEEACFKDPFPSYFLSQLADANPNTFLVAIVQERIVGYAVVDNWTDQQHLVSIAVSPGLRRRGIGQALLDALTGRLTEGRLGLEVRRSNKPAMEFYLKNGFSQRGISHSYYADGEDAILMEKNIPARVELLTPA